MMRGAWTVLMTVLLLFFPFSLAEAKTKYASKLSFRFSNGMLKNTGEGGGSATSLLAPNLVFDYYFSRKFAVGIGYYADFDFANAAATRRGIDASMKYYWKGPGTLVTRETPEGTIYTRAQTSYYAGVEFSQRNYYLGSNSEEVEIFDLTGSYSTINLLVGTHRRYSENFDLNFELSYGFFTFAGSDDRYAIQATLLQIGISYLFR